MANCAVDRIDAPGAGTAAAVNREPVNSEWLRICTPSHKGKESEGENDQPRMTNDEKIAKSQRARVAKCREVPLPIRHSDCLCHSEFGFRIFQLRFHCMLQSRDR